MLADKIYSLMGFDSSKPLAERISDFIKPTELYFNRDEYEQQQRLGVDKDVGATLLGESNDDEDEMRNIASIIDNRSKKRKQKMSDVVNERDIRKGESQFYGRWNTEAKRYLSGQMDDITKAKTEKVDRILEELRQGKFKNTLPGGEEFFDHFDGKFVALKEPPIPVSKRKAKNK